MPVSDILPTVLPGEKTYIIFDFNGGGIKGVIPARICTELEAYLKKPLYQIADLISGTSTGAILGGMLGAGVPAQTCLDLYKVQGPQLFKPRPWWYPVNWFREKYDRAPFIKAIGDALEQHSVVKKRNMKLNEMLTKFMCTSTSIVDGLTHYFKGWEDKDGQVEAGDIENSAISRSYAAAYYFGAIVDDAAQQVWADGGEGAQNCTLKACANEAINQGWAKTSKVYIISMGCGQAPIGKPYSEAKKMGWVGQVEYYLGIARNQSTIDQIYSVNNLKKLGVQIEFDRLDIDIPASMDELDAVKYINDFDNMAIQKLTNDIAKVVKKIQIYKP